MSQTIPLDTKPPTTEESVVSICDRLYPQLGIENVKEINSYDDRNYLVSGNNEEQFILKITNSIDTQDDGLLEGQNKLMLHLSRKYELCVPVPILNVHGQYLSKEELNTNQNGQKFAIRLLKYVSGTILGKLQLNKQLLIQCGEYLGKLQRCINDGYTDQSIKTRQYLWSLTSFPQARQYLYVLDQNPIKRQWVEEAMNRFETEIFERKDQFEHAYLHGDFNEQNILVKDGSISGIIDFGDIYYGPRIFDLAICIAYVMLVDMSDLDPVLDAPRYVLEGFIKHVPLCERELVSIPICSVARIAQSVTLGLWTYQQQPGNEYLLVTQTKGWKVLQRMIEFGPQRLIKEWTKS